MWRFRNPDEYWEFLTGVFGGSRRFSIASNTTSGSASARRSPSTCCRSPARPRSSSRRCRSSRWRRSSSPSVVAAAALCALRSSCQSSYSREAWPEVRLTMGRRARTTSPPALGRPENAENYSRASRRSADRTVNDQPQAQHPVQRQHSVEQNLADLGRHERLRAALVGERERFLATADACAGSAAARARAISSLAKIATPG